MQKMTKNQLKYHFSNLTQHVQSGPSLTGPRLNNDYHCLQLENLRGKYDRIYILWVIFKFFCLYVLFVVSFEQGNHL